MARLQGTVKIRVGIGMDGVVTSAKASGASKLLEAAAEENIRRWTFALGTESSVSRQAVITFVYRLEGKEEYDSPSSVVLDLPYRVEITSHPPDVQPMSR
jgi:TonB family protein